MRKLWVFLLAMPALALGGFVAIAYQGAVGSLASLRIACELLNTAERAGFLTRAQRADVVERSIREMRKASSTGDEKLVEMMEQFKAGCPALPTL
jgi:hypothetical protein